MVCQAGQKQEEMVASLVIFEEEQKERPNCCKTPGTRFEPLLAQGRTGKGQEDCEPCRVRVRSSLFPPPATRGPALTP